MRPLRRLTLVLAAVPFIASACSSIDSAPELLGKPLDLPFQVEWKTQATYLQTIFSISPKLAWVVGSGGTIMGTDDGGKTWVQQPSGTTGDLLGVSFADAQHGWVTGTRGTMLATTDGGKTWHKQSSGTIMPLYGVHFVDAEHGWAVGLQGTVITTGDGGKTWVQQPSGRTEGLFGVHFADPQHGWAVGVAGTILGTGDGGRTWSPQVSGTTANLYRVHFADPQHGWAVGDVGMILATVDGGNTWTKQNSDVLVRLIGMHFPDSRHGWAVGERGMILATSDGGKTWVPQVGGTVSSLNAVRFADAQHGWAAGEDGLIIQTADGGKTWTAQAGPPDATSLLRVHFADAQHGWAVGQAGTILATVDGGKRWAKQPSGTSATLRGIDFADAQHGWVVGDVGTILATADGGKSWTLQTSGTQTFLNRVDFVDLQHGWAVGSDGTVVATADGGKSWSIQARGMLPFLSGVHFVDSQHGWAVNAGATIVATADGGKSWNTQGSFRSPSIYDLEFADAQHGWVVGDGGTILATTDGGRSWAPQNSGTPLGMDGVSFTDALHGWAVGAFGLILATADGGKTWAPQTSGTTETLTDVSFADPQHGWAVGVKGLILTTADGGKTWVKQVGGSGKQLLTHVHFVDLEHGWASGLEGTIVATADGGKSWTNQASETTAPLVGIYFADVQRGWAVGDRGTIVATADGGKTWRSQASGTTLLLNCVRFFDEKHGWAVGSQGTVLRTEDGGENWKAQTSGTRAALAGIDFTDAFHGYAVGEAGTMIATTDGGETWVTQPSGTFAGLLGIDFADARHGWAVGLEGAIVATADGGKTWKSQTSGTQANFIGVSFADEQHGWAVGTQGTIVATSDGGKSWTTQPSGTALNLSGVQFVDPHHGWAVGQADTKLIATWSSDGPSLAEFGAVERAREVHLGWKVRDEHPDTITCTAVEFRQGSKAAWRSIDVTNVSPTGLDWAPDAAEYQVLPGTTLFYRVTLRDETGLTYTHEVPEGYTYRPFWNRQPLWVKAGICSLAVIGTYLAACGLLLVVYPVGIVRLWSVLSHSLLEPLDPSGPVRPIVGRAMALTGLPAFASMRRARIAWVRSFRNGRRHLDDLGESVRAEYLRHPEVLDVWVAQYREFAGRVFEDRFTVKARLDHELESKGWVPLPLWVIDRTENDPGPELLRQRLRPVFEKDVFRLLIHGDGGTGKTTLACLLAAWALEPAGESGLTPHAMLPILLEHELSTGPSPLRDAIRSALLDLVGQGTTVSDDLLDQLLRFRRLLVVVDHLSEMSQETRATICMNRDALPINALLITSRASEELDSSVTDRMETLKIDANHLTRFLDAYLAQRGKRDLFTDTEYEEARRRLANMLGRTDRSIPVLFPKLYADRLIAGREGVTDGVAQPLSIPELMSYYVVDQNRNVAEKDRLSDDLVNNCARAVAWESVRTEYRPLSAEWNDVLAVLRSRSAPDSALDYLVDRLRILRREESGRVRFGFDTLAEYLAAQECVAALGSDSQRWRSFLDEADEAASRAPLGYSHSFLYAVWDSAASPREQAGIALDGRPLSAARTRLVPEEILTEIGRRTGIDEASLRRIENLKFRNLIEQLTSKVVLLLGRFTPERKALLDDLWGELRQLGYMPVIFDFDKPSRRDRIETITLLAYLSRFLVVDITEARSVPAELQAILPNLCVPVRPILDGRDPQGSFALFEDFAKFEWLLLPVFVYDDPAHLLDSLKTEIVERAEDWIGRWNPAARNRRNSNPPKPSSRVNEEPRTGDAHTRDGPSSDKPNAVGDPTQPVRQRKYPVGL